MENLIYCIQFSIYYKDNFMYPTSMKYTNINMKGFQNGFTFIKKLGDNFAINVKTRRGEV